MSIFWIMAIAAVIVFMAVDFDSLPIIWDDEPIEGDAEISLDGINE